MTLLFAIILLAAFLSSFAATGVVRRYALRRRILDIPNGRSAHRIPTPRGGGVAMVLSFVAGSLALAFTGIIEASDCVALAGSAAIVGVVGAIDDYRSLGVSYRLLGHAVAACWALYFLGGMPPLLISGKEVPLGDAGNLLAAVGLVWLVNLYNFMDGIDGLAAVEAVTVCFGAAALALIGSSQSGQWHVPVLLGAVVCGFLIWNFPPARIFMGDAGSGFLGVALGSIALNSSRASPRLFWSWAILLGVFIVDATITLATRLWRGERVYLAHKDHAYQHAARRRGNHVSVTVGVAILNIAWLLPLALIARAGWLDGVVATALAYAPLVCLAAYYGAGRAEG